MKNKTKKSIYFRFLLKTVLIAGIGILCFTCILRVHRATGNTMSPFVRDGDLCVFYKLDKVYLNEVVLYHTENGKVRVGRVAAVGGQTIKFEEDGGYTVDGYEPNEEIPYETYGACDTVAQGGLTLMDDEVFIMNDFRSIADDSRESGPVNRKSIEGKLLFMLRRRNF